MTPSPAKTSVTADTDPSEETKETPQAKSGLKRAGSRHGLQQADDTEEAARYRPEFHYNKDAGTAKEKQEKIWDLMKTYIGTD